jgi:AcrR family transcriptional regulator
MDRRIQKTRQGLRDALQALLHDKPLDKIDIQEITDRANTARVTFYRHYRTKEELLLDMIEQIYKVMEDQVSIISIEQIFDFRLSPPSLPLFEFLAKDRAFYKKLFTGTVSGLVQQRLRHYIVYQITTRFSQSPRHANLPLFLISNYVASATIGNLMWWLADDLPYTPEHISQITHWISVMGVMNLVGRGDEIILPPDDVWRIPQLY